jgi:WhiB family redox-sensing transcriptional regulator
MEVPHVRSGNDQARQDDEITAWRQFAECRFSNPAIFFPDEDDDAFDSAPAKSVCSRCAVRRECLDFALSNHETNGIWGGMSMGQRRAYVRMARTTRTGITM